MCGTAQGATSFDGKPFVLRGGLDGWVGRFSGTDGTTQWLLPFGGATDDECAALGVDSKDHIVAALNHASSGVTFAGRPLADPKQAGVPAAAIVKLGRDGSFVWAYDVVAGGASITRVATAPNDDTLYAGQFLGAVDFGGGTIPAIDGGAARTQTFVVRRGP